MNSRRNRQSIDGFALRRRPQQQIDPGALGVERPQVPDRFLRAGEANTPLQQSIEPGQELPKPKVPHDDPMQQTLQRNDISASLEAIDQETPAPAKKRRFKLNKKIIKRVILVLLLVIVLAGAYVGIKAFLASTKVFKGNLFDLLGSGQQLKADQYGRSNILVFGTSEDDPDHDGANLTDSIMVVSLDQKNKNAAMMSVPRDLWVDFGTACNSGYAGKINEVYYCHSEDGANEKAGAEALAKIVGENFGLDIQYYAHVNYTVVRQAVDAVGGVDVTIESSDPRGILDRNFDWICNYSCYKVKYENGPAHLDGEHALYLARARNDAGGYGLPQGNFDREKNQQKILAALKAKATSAGTLSNPVAVTGLIDSLGNNVRTNFTGAEVKTLINLGKDIPSDKIKSISLVDPENQMMTTGNTNGISIVRPVAGISDFSEIQSYIRQKLNALSGESAVVDILNGSDASGVATAKAEELKEAGLSVGKVGDTPTDTNYAPIQWYDLSKGKAPKASTKLKQLLGVEAAGSTLPSGVQSSAEFVIIIGNGAN